MKRLLITAGPTREMLDPVRFLSNLSTGQMGYTLAEKARDLGYRVTLISGPTALPRPRRVQFIAVESTADLKKACEKYFFKNDALVMSAAVCDFTAKSYRAGKITRRKTARLELKKTPDILAGLGRRKGKRIVVGFCLETGNWLVNAKEKVKRKHLDGIVANYYSVRHNPFGSGKINTAFIDADFKVKMLRSQSKKQIAGKLLKWLESLERA